MEWKIILLCLTSTLALHAMRSLQPELELFRRQIALCEAQIKVNNWFIERTVDQEKYQEFVEKNRELAKKKAELASALSVYD